MKTKVDCSPEMTVMPTTSRSLSLISLVLRKSKHLLHKHYKKKARSFIIYHIL
jgi:hypothetical protein